MNKINCSHVYLACEIISYIPVISTVATIAHAALAFSKGDSLDALKKGVLSYDHYISRFKVGQGAFKLDTRVFLKEACPFAKLILDIFKMCVQITKRHSATTSPQTTSPQNTSVQKASITAAAELSLFPSSSSKAGAAALSVFPHEHPLNSLFDRLEKLPQDWKREDLDYHDLHLTIRLGEMTEVEYRDAFKPGGWIDANIEKIRVACQGYNESRKSEEAWEAFIKLMASYKAADEKEHPSAAPAGALLAVAVAEEEEEEGEGEVPPPPAPK